MGRAAVGLRFDPRLDDIVVKFDELNLGLRRTASDQGGRKGLTPRFGIFRLDHVALVSRTRPYGQQQQG